MLDQDTHAQELERCLRDLEVHPGWPQKRAALAAVLAAEDDLISPKTLADAHRYLREQRGMRNPGGYLAILLHTGRFRDFWADILHAQQRMMPASEPGARDREENMAAAARSRADFERLCPCPSAEDGTITEKIPFCPYHGG